MFDTHAHFPSPASALPETLARAKAAGVADLLAVGGSDELNRGALECAEAAGRMGDEAPHVHLALGLDRDQAGDGAVERARVLLHDSPPLAAVGELGLDYAVATTPHAAQIALLEAQMELASELRRPVVIHTREADDDTLAVLRNARKDAWFAGDRPGVIHCFTGSTPFAEQLLELGYYISFSGILTFASAASLRDTCRHVPLDRLLVETDCPYLAPVPLRGRRNEPAFVIHTARCLADQRNLDLAELERITDANAQRLFG